MKLIRYRIMKKMYMQKQILSMVALLCTCSLSILLPSMVQSSELSLGIANSTCASMKRAGKIFTAKTDIQLKYLCNPSGLLAQGIKEGELEIDYYLSANERWMDMIVEAGLVDSATIRKNWGNRLVVASLPLKSGELRLQNLNDLQRPEVKQILMGDPGIAPYGMYAEEAMIQAGVWEQIQPKIKQNRKISISIRTLKKYGLSKKGVVALLYQTNVTGNLLTHFVVPVHLYSPIYYFSAPLVKSVHRNELAQFLAFIESEEASAVFKSAGFIINP